MTEYLEKVSETEAHFCRVGMDCVFLAKNPPALKALLIAAVWSAEDFLALPKRSQSYVAGYLQGAADAAAKLMDMDKPVLLEERDAKAELPPKEILDLQPGIEWHKHPNGGGWISSTAYVEASASISGRAAVFGNARVLDRTRVYGSARIAGNAECFGAPHIHGRAVVGGNAKVYDAAKVLGDAQVYGYVEVGGQSVVRGDVVLDGTQVLIDEHVTDRAAAKRSNGRVRAEIGSDSSRPV
jgi:carbonic anhydrase/acetyltransferase-like protein (isoleucine patch superfamily)